MTELNEGDRAPEFDMPTDGDGRARLSDFQGQKVILYFYPKDDTPGCTKEAVGFTEKAAEFKDAGAVVIGVSKDTVAKHDKFKAKYELSVILASDAESDVAERYGSWVLKKMYGREYMGLDRSTFLIDGEGVLRKIWRKVKVPGHVEAVLDATRAI